MSACHRSKPAGGFENCQYQSGFVGRARFAAGKKGVIVLDVAANSEARRAGFRIGDIVLQINASPVERVQDVLRLAQCFRRHALEIRARQSPLACYIAAIGLNRGR